MTPKELALVPSGTPLPWYPPGRVEPILVRLIGPRPIGAAFNPLVEVARLDNDRWQAVPIGQLGPAWETIRRPGWRRAKAAYEADALNLALARAGQPGGPVFRPVGFLPGHERLYLDRAGRIGAAVQGAFPRSVKKVQLPTYWGYSNLDKLTPLFGPVEGFIIEGGLTADFGLLEIWPAPGHVWPQSTIHNAISPSVGGTWGSLYVWHWMQFNGGRIIAMGSFRADRFAVKLASDGRIVWRCRRDEVVRSQVVRKGAVLCPECMGVIFVDDVLASHRRGEHVHRCPYCDCSVFTRGEFKVVKAERVSPVRPIVEEIQHEGGRRS